MTAVTTLTALPSSDGRIYTKYPEGDRPITCTSTHLDDTFWTITFGSWTGVFWETGLAATLTLNEIGVWAEGFRPTRIIVTARMTGDDARTHRLFLSDNSSSEIASNTFLLEPNVLTVIEMDITGQVQDIGSLTLEQPGPVNTTQKEIHCIQFVE